MSSGEKFNNRDGKFSLGTGEPKPDEKKQALALATTSLRSTAASRGSDPYNTSGSFDRKKNWERVGKR